MKKIASPNELTTELTRLLAYAQSSKPSRERLASELGVLADGLSAEGRTAGDKLDRPTQEMLDLCEDLKRILGQIKRKAKEMQRLRPEAARQVSQKLEDIESMALDMAMDLENLVL